MIHAILARVQISIVNRDPAISTARLLQVIRAINIQIERDFEPYWHMSARLRLDSWDPALSTNKLSGLRGDAILYIVRKPSADVAGYHETHQSGVPFGFVFTSLAEEMNEPWSVTLSHEALELLADPECNLLCKGPHPDPDEHGRHVFHWLEVCDAVQAEHYEIDGVAVANFVLPQYFTGSEELDGRNDFLATQVEGRQLRSFSCNPGGYVGYYDPECKENRTFMDSPEATRRAKLKAARLPKHLRRGDRRDQEFSVSTDTSAKTQSANKQSTKKQSAKKQTTKKPSAKQK